jgi:hypothetical protein
MTLNWGMIGGGEGSQIGPAHRLGAQADGNFAFVAGALDADPRRARLCAALGVAPDRAYGDWREMLEGERGPRRPRRSGDRGHAQRHPFRDHQGLPRGGLPRAVRKADDHDRRGGRGDRPRRARGHGPDLRGQLLLQRYPMVRQMRRWCARGDLGKDPPGRHEFQPWPPRRRADADNPRVRWRYDPAQAGVSGSSPIAASTRCIWRASSPGDEVERCPPISPPASKAASWKTTRWSISAPRAARSGGSGPRRCHRAPARARHPGLWRKGRAALGAGAAQPALLDAAGRAHADHGEGRGGLGMRRRG